MATGTKAARGEIPDDSRKECGGVVARHRAGNAHRLAATLPACGRVFCGAEREGGLRSGASWSLDEARRIRIDQMVRRSLGTAQEPRHNCRQRAWSWAGRRDLPFEWLVTAPPSNQVFRGAQPRWHDVPARHRGAGRTFPAATCAGTQFESPAPAGRPTMRGDEAVGPWLHAFIGAPRGSGRDGHRAVVFPMPRTKHTANNANPTCRQTGFRGISLTNITDL